MKVILSGGGTLGPVTPLLAIYESVQKTYPELEWLWVGTEGGQEEELVVLSGIPFVSFPSSKLRRYFSLSTFFDIFRFVSALIRSFFFLRKHRPDLCISAGGYVSVPLHLMARLFGIPTWIHQQDVAVGLANRLMAPSANLITVTLEKSVSSFSKTKTVWLGNPIREEIGKGKKEIVSQMFDLSSDLPVVFVTGGGTGSERINTLLLEALPYLKGSCHIIHLTGRNRKSPLSNVKNYHPIAFVNSEMKDFYAASDFIISRGGFGTLSEIASVEKPVLVIPKKGHQEENVRFFEEAGAILSLDEEKSNGKILAEQILETLHNKNQLKNLGRKLAHILPAAKPSEILRLFEGLTKRKK